MPDYIEFPIETDPQDLLGDAYDFLQAQVPGWEPADANLDVWLLQAISLIAAQSRDVASAVPRSIFRWFGATLVGIAPIDSAPATADTTWTVINNAGYTIPAGTQVSVPATGNQGVAFVTESTVVIPPGSTVATGVAIVAVDPGAASSGLGATGTAITLLDPLAFVASVTLAATTSGGQDAESDDDYLNKLASQLALLAPRPILPDDFSVFARNIAGVHRATTLDGYNPFHNLLTLNEASVETDVSNWNAILNCTIARSTAQSVDGVASIAMTSVAAGAAYVAQQSSSYRTVTPGETITGLFFVRSAAVARSFQAGINWKDNTLTNLSGALGATVTSTTTGWSLVSVTGVVPPGATLMELFMLANPTAGGEVHYYDKMALRRGSSTTWVPGGTSETGNPRMVAIAVLDENGNTVSSTVKNAVQADLQARREVTFVVNVIDPTITQVDITYNVHLLPRYDSATVLAAVNAALGAYLSPATWGLTPGVTTPDWANSTVVRYLEIAQVINSVEGVDYITTTGGNSDLTLGLHGGTLTRTDLTLAGPVSLPALNTATGTSS